MTRKERTFELRNCPEPHYNCAQATAMPLSPEMGLEEEQTRRLLQNFGGGMGCGSVCGALTGALTVLGGAGLPMECREEIIGQFREKFGSIECGQLTAGLERGDPEMRARCGQFIEFAVDWVCGRLGVE